jgi:hypothetical protein
MNIITPDEFEAKMESFIGDPHDAHVQMDDLMEKTLISLGYEKGVEVFQKQDKWYE